MVEIKGSMETFPLLYHSRMLADEHRLNCFKTAIDRIVQEDSHVVDLGGGTGVLTQMLAQKTNGLVTYIDMLEASSIVAQILNRGLSKNIQYISKKSFDVQLKDRPDVLVTETLGYFGIDEGIVELCHDFCTRHPSIKMLIPSKVSLKYQFIHLPELNADFDLLLSSYASRFGSVPAELVSEFERLFCNLIRKKIIKSDGMEVCSEPKLIRRFNLGLDKSSDTEYSVECKASQRANAIHFYFEAELADGVKLSNYVFEPKTHWLHSYAGIPKGISSGQLKFVSTERKIRLRWK
ncbi:class I SAM-dependent methyltransferase [Photorhabdus akhurstii]|uniref:class I SAM-dependent methyltransferase n=1 Tax=Photorhabdus akhurstii TaxID=171438 RepID=UPI00052DDEC0|nr:class I SAM-dependent methyltransferase [Photorhabdus akhurstii]KGM29872.1 hypothetical protein KS18_03125 [Photorhabdus luminescens]MBS9427119.1 class I SAM-dependent methyltransferase [Photorhabdus akhurstii]